MKKPRRGTREAIEACLPHLLLKRAPRQPGRAGVAHCFPTILQLSVPGDAATPQNPQVLARGQ